MNQKTKTSPINCYTSFGGIPIALKKAFNRNIWVLLCVVIAQMMLLAPSASAQTASLLATNKNILVGANFSGVYTNSQLRAILTGTGASAVTVSVAGAPSGVTILFSTNAYLTAANPLTITNSWNPIWYSVAVTNVAKGVYPLTFTLSGAASASAVANLIVGTLWTNATPAGDVQWSTAANWSAGVPSTSDDALFLDGGNTNYVNSSFTVSSLWFLPLLGGAVQNMTIAPGQTLAVLGTNSFSINSDSVTTVAKLNTLNIFGAGGASLVVSNNNGVFSANSSQGTGGAATGLALSMTNLDNFSCTVSRFGLGDWTMVKAGGVAANEMAPFSFAKTNIIKALYAGNYDLTNLTPTFAVSLLQEGDAFNNGSVQTINLGLSNAIFAESIALAQNRAGGNPNSFRFNPVFTNGSLGVPTVSFRNTNGGRVNLVGVGVDSGISNPGSNSRGVLNFSGGIVDMLVDTIWLGRDRAMSGNTNSGAVGLGVLTFTGGKVDVNTLRAGYQAYTNNSSAQGQINVGGSASTTATLFVNNTLELGFTAGDVNATPGASAALGNGQVTINTNGIVRANRITVGTLSANNFITINNGGSLDVTNTVASTNKSLSTLTAASGKLVLHLTGTNTVIYATNLTTSGSSSISIASISGISAFPVTIPVIAYVNGAAAAFIGGTAPGGVNVSVANNTGNKTIDVTLNTGTPKSLVWKGYVDNNWDFTTTNWQDIATGFPTNFSTGDNVVFDDTAATASINVAADVIPRQSVLIPGIAITNNLLAYSFSGSGKILGSSTLVKSGTNSLQIDNYSESVAQIKQGTLTGSGTVGSVSVANGASLLWLPGGTIISGVSAAGLAINSGTINGGLSLSSGGVATNAGTINGSFTTGENTLFVNSSSATLSDIGSSTVETNSLFVNQGNISGLNLTVNGGGTFKDTGEGTITLNGLLTIGASATFIPGGDGVGTTTIQRGAGGGTFPGRVLLARGSTNVFKVNIDNGTYTKLGSAFQDFGGSASVLTYNGCNIQIINVGSAPFAAGQSFTFFVNSDNNNNPPISVTGSATNTYPLMIPTAPGSGLAWNLNGITTSGSLSIVGVNANSTNLVFNTTFTTLTTTNSTNNVILVDLAWPSDHTGWRLQTQQNPLSVGLGTNWVDIFGAAWTNNLILTNSLISSNSVFYRMVYP